LDPHFNQGKLLPMQAILLQAGIIASYTLASQYQCKLKILQANILAKCKAPLGQGTMNLTFSYISLSQVYILQVFTCVLKKLLLWLTSKFARALLRVIFGHENQRYLTTPNHPTHVKKPGTIPIFYMPPLLSPSSNSHVWCQPITCGLRTKKRS
jgi:hypothetical protein